LKFLRNLMESLLRRLQAIIDGQGNPTKYQPEGLYTLWTLLMPKSINKGGVYPNYK
jgi:hypothetical protein